MQSCSKDHLLARLAILGTDVLQTMDRLPTSSSSYVCGLDTGHRIRCDPKPCLFKQVMSICVCVCAQLLSRIRLFCDPHGL